MKELNKIGIPTSSIYVDTLIQSINTDSKKVVMALDADSGLLEKFPRVC